MKQGGLKLEHASLVSFTRTLHKAYFHEGWINQFRFRATYHIVPIFSKAEHNMGWNEQKWTIHLRSTVLTALHTICCAAGAKLDLIRPLTRLCNDSKVMSHGCIIHYLSKREHNIQCKTCLCLLISIAPTFTPLVIVFFLVTVSHARLAFLLFCH